MEENFRKMVEEAFNTDLKEIANGPIKEMTEILTKVYEMGVMRGMELQHRNLQGLQTIQRQKTTNPL